MAVSRLQAELGSFGLKIRWVPPQNVHLTLKFLGDVALSEMDAVAAAMAAAATPASAITLNACGTGVFPGAKNPRVLWVGLTGERVPLRRLQEQLSDQLRVLGYAAEKRPFRAHLTIGRFKQRPPASKIVELLRQSADFKTAAFTVAELTLFRSDLNPGGAVYTKLAGVPLV